MDKRDLNALCATSREGPSAASHRERRAWRVTISSHISPAPPYLHLRCSLILQLTP